MIIFLVSVISIVFTFLSTSDTVVKSSIYLSGILIGAGLIITFSTNKNKSVSQMNNKSTSNTTSEPDQNQVGTEQMNVLELRNSADEFLIEAESLRNDGKPDEAIELFQRAIEQYDTAVERCSDGEIIEELNDELEEIEQKQHKIKSLSETLPEVQEALELAEGSLQTAIAAHVSDEATIARIRYRQARDQYQAAIEQIEATDVALLAEPIEISVNRERSVESQSLDNIFELTADEEKNLHETGLSTISDLQSEEVIVDVNDKIKISRIQKLQTSSSITDKLAHQLTALHFSYDDEKYEFTSKDDIELRLQQAVNGYNITK